MTTRAQSKNRRPAHDEIWDHHPRRGRPHRRHSRAAYPHTQKIAEVPASGAFALTETCVVNLTRLSTEGIAFREYP